LSGFSTVPWSSTLTPSMPRMSWKKSKRHSGSKHSGRWR
jgi:hypothetical protein